jgi:parallel beta-helix repeat protein
MKPMHLTLAALAIALITSAAGPAESRRTFFVDDDKQQCPQADFMSISPAITVAKPGDTIKVCPGLYSESVVVNKPDLVLEGSTTLAEGAPCLRGDSASDSAKHSIIHGRVRLEADRAKLDGFTVELAPGGEAGVYTSPSSSGYVISHDVIQQNEGGINLNSSGAQPTLVVHNCLRSNNENDPAGLSAVAMFSEQGLLHNARIESNTFTGHLQGSMFLGYGLIAFPIITAPSTDITVAHNEIIDDGDFGVFLNNVSRVEVADNKIIRVGQGIDVFPPASRVSVERNQLEDNPIAGIRVDGTPFGCCSYPSGPTNVIVARNSVLRSGSIGPRDGILLFATSGQTVVDNEIRDSYKDGISIRGGSSGNLIAGNHVEGSGRDGIRNRDTSAGNTYRDNHLMHNGEHDAHDENRSTNTWTDNQCETDSPAGTICGVR